MIGTVLALAAALSWWDPTTVRPQQKGVCITEWEGGQRLEIPVEVLGVLDAPSPERTTVLVRLTDGRFAGAGPAAGMSGSPVYLDGKLLGALAFGWAFAREPLAGVTPFSLMHEITAGGAAASGTPPTLPQLAGLAAGKLDPLAILPSISPAGRGGPYPVAVGGLPPSAGFAADVLARAGLVAIPAGGDAAIEGAPEAGEMAAVVLVWGDALLAAAGTVTAREGNTLYAFGHPLFALGAVRLPAARARVLAVQSSYQSSFKLFSIGRPFGTFVADRPAGMLAQVGDPPAGIPVAVSLHDATGASSWRFQIAEVPVLEPLLVTFLVNACLTARGAAAGDASVRVRLTLHMADRSAASIEQAARGADALARVAAFAGSAVGFLVSSGFPHPPLAAIEVELEREERRAGAVIAEVIPARSAVRPGETLTVEARLLPDGGPALTREVTIQVPATTPPGTLDLIVADGAAWSDYRLKAEGIAPARFADELAQLGMLESSATLVMVLESRDKGLAVPGASQPALPPSWAATLATGLGSKSVTRLTSAVVASARWHAPYPLEGAFRIPLTVLPPRTESE